MAQSCVLANCLRKIRPVVLLTKSGQGPTVTVTSGCQVVMTGLEDLFLKTGRDRQEPRRVAVSKIILVDDTLLNGEG